MRMTRLWCVLGVAVWAPLAYSQNPEMPWEVGISGGFGWHSSKSVSAPGGSASAGIGQGLPVSGYLGHNMYEHVSGEIRYTFQMHDLKLSSGGTKAGFNARSQALHYDFLIHGSPSDAKVRPFIALGAGIKYFQGTGTEVAFQPLSQFAILTKTNEWLGMGTIAGGAKLRMSERMIFRVELRYYITPFPDQVLAPSSGGRLKGWLHNLVPMAGISYTF